MNVCVIGSGGREHALAWKIRQSSKVDEVFTLPGNGGTLDIGQNVPIGPSDFEEIAEFVLSNQIGLLVIGPEEPLVQGIRDYFESKEQLSHVAIVGPSAKGAVLEGSKDFSKQFMLRHQIPTANAITLEEADEQAVRKSLGTFQAPFVIKADGLAAGKGVVICDNFEESVQITLDMLKGSLGKAGHRVLLEEFMDGMEVSVFILTDGDHYILLPEAKDYKRIGEDDTGPNTGGMGAVSPVYFADEVWMKKVEDRIIIPTLEGLKKEKIDYRGFLFFGLMNHHGEPKVIEYNARMGDPETEIVMCRLAEDLVPLLLDCHHQELTTRKAKVYPGFACGTVLVSEGYPGPYPKGRKITLPELSEHEMLFHSGTKMEDGQLTTQGGRVLVAVCLDEKLENARKMASNLAQEVKFDGKYYRKDIGLDILNGIEKLSR